MTAALYLVPALAGGVAMAGVRVIALRRAAGLVGVGAGLVLFAVGDGLEAWRATEAGIPVAFAALGSASSFALVLVTRDVSAAAAAQVGIASSSLILFAAGEWVVPALLFWVVSSLALALPAADSTRRGSVWLALALSDAVLLVAVGAAALDAGTWTMPQLSEWQVSVVVGAALVRVGAVPWTGQWPIERSSSAVIVPLLVAGGYVLIGRFVEDPEPVIGAGAIVVGVLVAAVAAVRRFDMRSVGTGIAALTSGLALATPAARAACAVAALCAASVVALWPQARGRGRLSRGVVLASGPPTIGFAALAAGASNAFVNARAGTGPEGAAWSVIAVALPLALAAGLALGAMAARREPSDDFEPPAVLATWCVVGFSMVAGVWLGAFVPAGDVVVDGSTRALYLVALVAAALAALRASNRAPVARYAAADVLLSEVLPPRWTRIVLIAFAGLVEAGSIAGLTYLTVRGLQQGFLT